MTAATNASTSKPSRYRTIRGKNVPESLKYVVPIPTASTASTSSSSDHSTTRSRTSTVTANSSSNGSGLSDSSSQRLKPGMTCVTASSNDRPPLPTDGCQNETIETDGRKTWNMADAVQHAPSSQQQYQQQASSTATTATPTSYHFNNRPPPLPPTRLDTSFSAQLPAHASLHVHSPVAGVPTPSPTPILVPLPSARARGLKHEVLAGSDALDTDEVARRDAEAHRLLAEQKRKDLERLERELANHLTSANLPLKSSSREKFSFLNLRRGLSSSAPPTPTSLPQTSPDQPPLIPVSPNSPIGGYFNRSPTSYTSSCTQPGPESSHTPSLASAGLSMGIPSSAPGCGADQVSPQTFFFCSASLVI